MTDEDRRLLAAAAKYIDDPNSDPFSMEGLEHMNIILADIIQRAKRAAIISSKSFLQESVGESAAFDLYYHSQASMKAAHFATAFSILLKSMTDQNATTISIQDIQKLYAEILLDTTKKHNELETLGSTIRHIVVKEFRKATRGGSK